MSKFFATQVNRPRPRVLGRGMSAVVFGDGSVVISQRSHGVFKSENWQYSRR